jgi:hypothetical protein
MFNPGRPAVTALAVLFELVRHGRDELHINRCRREQVYPYRSLSRRDQWQYRSSLVELLGVGFAPPHVKTGRLAFPRAVR